MKSRIIFVAVCVCMTTSSMAATVQDDINERCREEVGDEKDSKYQECVEREEQRFQEWWTRIVITDRRGELEKSLGTARQIARRCGQFDIDSDDMSTAYCLRRFDRAIAIASVTTGCKANVGLETLFLVREELRSIWFFDTRSFLAVVEEVLKENFDCAGMDNEP